MSKAVPADLTRVINIARLKGSHDVAAAKALRPLEEGLRGEGYTWFRITDDPRRVYLEAWRVKPANPAPLNRNAAVEVEGYQRNP